ncbi:hypothetical protein AmaxDRAFT_4035 [Limnospira maxima CS-328]|uniref:Uncharacterized protein n=1 Tax=Limnospira maxima CS-328 TaxID=513049 RepID=B5W5I6_LIMMA|nr:hypothetical protein AmaxDRAFT_4035 [Limnospira maxima CS-328]
MGEAIAPLPEKMVGPVARRGVGINDKQQGV